ATAAVVAAGPVGLSWRGRTAPLAWTRRLRTLAGVWACLEAAAVAGGAVAGEGPGAGGGGGVGGPRPGRPGLRPHRSRRTASGPVPRGACRGPAAPGGAHGGGHHRLVRQDEDPGVVGPTAFPDPVPRGQPRD